VQFGFGTPFFEQLEFFRKKLNLPSEHWDDIQREAHDRAFIVAGATKADLLDDLQQSVFSRMADGRGLEEFRKDFRRIVGERGWQGWTGEGSPGGFAWRTRVIYQTNMATSYAAGRYRQLTDPEYLQLRPYWRYKHADGVMNPRLQHVALNGLTLRYDHPFWKTHFPPNGWFCHCRVVPVDAREYAKAQAAGLAEPPAGWDEIDPKTGEQVGIAKGFGYTPGANADAPLRQFVQDKLITYPPAITRALSRDINRYINADERAVKWVAGVLADRSRTDPLWLGFVEDFETVSAAAEVDVKGYMVTAPADAPRHVEASHGHDGNGQRPAEPLDYEAVVDVLNEPDALTAGKLNRHGGKTVVATKKIDGETYRAVFEVLTGKKSRMLSLLSLVIKT